VKLGEWRRKCERDGVREKEEVEEERRRWVTSLAVADNSIQRLVETKNKCLLSKTKPNTAVEKLEQTSTLWTLDHQFSTLLSRSTTYTARLEVSECSELWLILLLISNLESRTWNPINFTKLLGLHELGLLDLLHLRNIVNKYFGASNPMRSQIHLKRG
jgi:hypothetical protein